MRINVADYIQKNIHVHFELCMFFAYKTKTKIQFIEGGRMNEKEK